MTKAAFDWAGAIKARPGGKQTSDLIAVYGNPKAPGWGKSKQGGAWFEPAPAWQKANLVRVSLDRLPGFPPYPGAQISGVTVHRLVAPVLIATWEELMRRGLADKLRTFNGAYAPRHMGHTHTRPLSVHAFGAAIDFDAAWNGYGLPLDQAQMNRDVARCFEECGWTWGGRWGKPYEDAMHFQYTAPVGGNVPAHQDAMARRPAPVIAGATPPAAVARPQVIFNGIEVTGTRVQIGNLTVNAENPAKVFVNLAPDSAGPR